MQTPFCRRREGDLGHTLSSPGVEWAGGGGMLAESAREGAIFSLCVRNHMKRVVVLRHWNIENSEEEDGEM